MIKISTFRGIAPRYAKRKLADFNSQTARNVDLFSKELRPLKNGIVVNNPSKQGDILTIFPLGSNWLHWNEDVDVAQSPLNVDDEGRIYYTGRYNPKSTNTALAGTGAGTDYPLISYRLGLPAPDNGPTIGITGGSSGVPETRSYVYTYVTEWGEEGPPSPATEYIAAHNDATSWDLSVMDVAPLNTGTITNIVVAAGKATFTVSAAHFLETGDYLDLTGIVGTGDLPGTFNDVGPLQVTRESATTFSIALTPSGSYTSGGTWTRESQINTSNMTKRIYRTSGGVFKFVAEIAVATTTYADSITEANLGEEIPGIDDYAWRSPPSDMKGITMMAGGIAVGFYKNVLAFAYPYAPHAYPLAYELALDYTIVAIEAVGNTLIVGTTGRPYMVIGVDPEGMTDTKLGISQSCISKRSMVSILNGAMYASPDGLVYVPVAGAPEIITRNWMKETDWRKFNPSTINATVYDDRYYGFYSGGGDDGNESGAIVFDPAELDSTFTKLGVYATACYSDLTTDSFYYFDGDNRSIYRYGYGGGYETFEWRSKVFTTPMKVCFKAGLVRFSAGDSLLASEVGAAIQASIDSVTFGINNYTIHDSGGFGGFSPGVYTVAGGPYLSAVNAIRSNTTAIFRIYANEELKYEKQLSDSKPFRIPKGLKPGLFDTWEIELTGNNVNIHEAMIAETISELAKA